MPQVNSLLIPILLKIAIFEILPKFEPIFRDEEMEVAKKTARYVKKNSFSLLQNKTELKKIH